MRRFLNDFWETITKQPIDISECETFQQARRWFIRRGIDVAKAAKTPGQLRDILLDNLANRPFDTNDKMSRDIRRYLNGLDEDVDTNRPIAIYERRLLDAETPYDLEKAQKEYKKFMSTRRRRSNP